MSAGGSQKRREFNDALLEAIDETIQGLFSRRVLEALNAALANRYDVTRDELPYRLDTLHKILHDLCGIRGSETINRQIAHRLYQKLGIKFVEVPHLGLSDYVEIAKNKLAGTVKTNNASGHVAKTYSQSPLSTRGLGYGDLTLPDMLQRTGPILTPFCLKTDRKLSLGEQFEIAHSLPPSL